MIKDDDKYLFRRLLKSFAKLKNDVWTLNKEWICSVCCRIGAGKHTLPGVCQEVQQAKVSVSRGLMRDNGINVFPVQMNENNVSVLIKRKDVT